MRRVLAVGLALISACGNTGMTVSEAWTRPSPPGADEAAIYMVVKNDSESQDRLLSASSPSCLVVTPHLTEIVDGVARMRESGLDELDMDPGSTLVMEPNAMHLMCLGLTGALEAGEVLDIALEFREAGTITVGAAIEHR